MSKSTTSHKWMEEPTMPMVNGLLTCGLITPGTKVKLRFDEPNLNNSCPITEKPRRSPSVQRMLTQPDRKKRIKTSVGNQTRRAKTAQISPSASGATLLDSFAVPPVPFLTPALNDQEPIFLSIDELLSTKKRYASRREAETLLAEYITKMDQFRYSTNEDPVAQTQKLENMINVTFLTWNSVITSIRGYSDEYARLLLEIKKFVQFRVENFPNIVKKYNIDIESLKELNGSQKDDISSLKFALEQKDGDIEILNYNIDQLKAKIGQLESEKMDLNNNINNTEYTRENLENEFNSAMLRFSRAEEEKRQALKSLESTKQILENCKNQISQQEKLIQKYEEEGAGFRPLYIKATSENQQYSKEIEEMSEIMKKMVERQETVNVEVQTDAINNNDAKSKSGSKSKTRNRTQTMKKVSGPPIIDEALPKDVKANRTSSKKLNFEKNLATRSEKMLKSALQGETTTDASESKMSSDDSSSNLTNSQTVSQKKQSSGQHINFQNQNWQNNQNDKYVEEDATDKPHKEQKNDSIKINKSLTFDDDIINKERLSKSNKSNELLTSSAQLSTQSSISQFIYNPTLPSDYDISSKFVADSQTLVNSIYRLLPLPIGYGAGVNGFKSQLVEGILSKHTNSPKSYNWLVQRIVGFFHSILNMNQISNIYIDTVMMLQNAISEKTKLRDLSDRIFNDLIQTAQCYRSTKIVDILFKFILFDFSTVEYKFFNMLFNLSFEYIYPPVITVINDPDVTPAHPQFLIHKKIAEDMALQLFKHIPENEYELSEIKECREWPDLLDFWDFSEKMIKLFTITHMKYHRQVKGILTLVGWNSTLDNSKITQSIFADFFIFIRPSLEEKDLQKMYDRFTLEKELKNGFKTESKIDNDCESLFIRFCSDFPDIASDVLNLRGKEDFEKLHKALTTPLQNLLDFIKKRFTDYIRHTQPKLTSALIQPTKPILFQMRNALFRCDVSTSFSCYRHILQLIDVKCSEANPFTVFSNSINIEEVQEAVQLIIAREKVVAAHLFDKSYKTPEFVTNEPEIQIEENIDA